MKTIDQIVSQLRREALTPEQKQRLAAVKKQWRLDNIEKVRKTNRDYYLKNKEAIAVKTSARYYARKVEKTK